MTQLTDKKIKSLLKGLDTSSLCDIKKDLRVMSSDIRPILPRGPYALTPLIGRARTVSVLDDFLTVIKALHEALPGEVLVIDGRGGTKALLGELFCAEAIRKKLAGIVIDGACRDMKTLQLQSSFPLWSRGHTPMAGSCRQLFETQTSITCGGVSVEPGEIIFGDEDGIVVMSERELSDLAVHAWTLQKVERHVLSSVRQGKPLLSMTNAIEHLNAIADGKESKLCFDLLDETDMN